MKQYILLAVMALLFVVSSAFAWLESDQGSVANGQKESHYFGMPVTNVAEALALSRQVARMTIKHYDSQQAIMHIFEVANRDGAWTIPSHHDYPADGGDQVGRTAGSVLGLVASPDARITDNPRDHARLGVLDPEDTQAPFGIERGRRITLKGAEGETILDVIIGKEIPDRSGWYYLRQADEDAVYEVEMTPVLSTRFIDYVNQDLLQVARDEVTEVVLDPHRVNRQAGSVTTAPTLTLNREQGGQWTSPEAPTDQVVDINAIRKLLDGVTRVRLQGVRPLQPLSMERMARFGFFTNDGATIWGYEGAVEVQRNNGLRYILYFGERAPDEGLALTAGIEQDGTESVVGNNRYMIIIVKYRPSEDRLLEQLLSEREQELQREAAAAAAAAETEVAEVDPAQLKKALDDLRREHSAERRALTDREQEKFLQFFYVIPASVFDALQPNWEALFSAPPETGTNPGSDPNTITPGP